MKTQRGAKQQQNVSKEWESERGEKEQKSELTKRARAVTVCVCMCVCVLRSYVFALETLALDEPGREIESERERETKKKWLLVFLLWQIHFFFIPKVAANLN